MNGLNQPEKTKRIQRGITTSDLVRSAYINGNAEIFPKILELHVPKESLIADVTWENGVFWRNVREDDYRLLASDIATGTDCRNLPYTNESIDCVVLDPLYMEGFTVNRPTTKPVREHIRLLPKRIHTAMKRTETLIIRGRKNGTRR